MFQWVRTLFGRTPPVRREPVNPWDAAPPAPGIEARYESADTRDDNRRNWVYSDNYSAKAANSFSVRQQLRRRSRYEFANNAYYAGIVRTSTNDLIGTGPTLQVRTTDAGANQQVERAWADWCRAVGLTEKLRTIRQAKLVDGEGFLVLKSDESIDHSVKLYPQDVEADQVTTPNPKFSPDYWVDGMVLDNLGRPRAYHVLRYHPGDLFLPTLNPLEHDTVPARNVIHWFRKDRPGQVRGIPEGTAALDVSSEARSYRKAVLANARLSASLTAVIETEAPALSDADDDSDGAEPFKSVPIDVGMMTTLPSGAKLNPFDAKQPTAQFDAFHDKLIGETARCFDVPNNVALGTSQKFNFSSARLDHVNYRGGLTVERQQCEEHVLERLFAAWLEEAVMIPGLLPKGVTAEACPHEWHWPGFPALDPVADAQADADRLAAGTMTYAEYWAGRGKDWRDQFKQLAEEKKLREELGLSFAAAAAAEPGSATTEAPATEAANAA